jgi:uncharacterized protein (DUF433 family)
LHQEEPTGVLRVGNTRVLLELVVHAHQHGEPPEAIVEMYDALEIADVFAVIAYYLAHQAEVDEYVRERDENSRATIRFIRGDIAQDAALIEASVRPETFRVLPRPSGVVWSDVRSDLLQALHTLLLTSHFWKVQLCEVKPQGHIFCWATGSTNAKDLHMDISGYPKEER